VQASCTAASRVQGGRTDGRGVGARPVRKFLRALMFPVKGDGMLFDLIEDFEQLVRLGLHRAGGGAQRRRSIKLLFAGWLPPSVLSSRGFPRSRRRASGSGPAT
jgi:hypothetical protein